MQKIRILFLGASKRVSLLENFLKAADRESVSLQIFSCETKADFFPISHIATILVGPKFNSKDFQEWLLHIIPQYNIDIIVPNMDSATVALSLFSKANKNNVYPVVSDYQLCKIMDDKILANTFFIEHGIRVVGNSTLFYPKIIKPKNGFGSKGIKLIESKKQLEDFLKHNDKNQFIIQDYLKVSETTVDMFISRSGKLIGYVLRDRIEVSDGEVMVCKTRNADKKEELLIQKISQIPGWKGCITIQFFKDSKSNIFINEINPRFGGGATCSIEAGLDMPRYIIKDFLNKKITIPKSIKHLFMTRARRDFFYEI